MTEENSLKDGWSRRKWIAAASAAIAAPFAIRVARAQQPTIKVGFPVPLTGPYGAEAQDQVRAAQVAIAEFNETGGLKGRLAELLVRDDKLNPGEAATRALELIEGDKVDFIVGSLSASVQLAVNNVTKARKVLYNSISQSDAINEAKDFSRYTFHEALNPHMTAGAVGRYAFPKFGKRVAFLTADYAYGYEMVRGFQSAGKAFGVETLVDIRHPLGTTDFSTLLPRIESLKPDILVISNFGRDQQIALKQATDFGLKKSIKILAPILLYTGRIAAGARAFDGVLGGTSYYWGLESSVPSAKAFNDRVPKDARRAGAFRLWLARLRRGQDVPDGGAPGRRHGSGWGDRRDGIPELRLLQGPGTLSKVRSSIRAVRLHHRIQGRPARRSGRVQYRRPPTRPTRRICAPARNSATPSRAHR